MTDDLVLCLSTLSQCYLYLKYSQCIYLTHCSTFPVMETSGIPREAVLAFTVRKLVNSELKSSLLYVSQ